MDAGVADGARRARASRAVAFATGLLARTDTIVVSDEEIAQARSTVEWVGRAASAS